MIVDDSAFMRFAISKHLADYPDIQFVGSAHDGVEALELIPRLQPDVITMDVEMPRLDGLSTLRRIMAEDPRPVIMLSSLTKDGAVETVQALTLGAVDFIGKPENKASIALIIEELVVKIRRAATVRVSAFQGQITSLRPNNPSAGKLKITRPVLSQDKVVVIGSSTGGPRALNLLVPALPANLPAAVLIVQHMPAGFTRSLAERLDSLSQLKVKEAEPGDQLEIGRVLLAPGGFHLLINDQGQVTLNQNPTVHGVRPAIDVTMVSVVKKYKSSVVSVILTGMGNDGTNGSALVSQSGGYVIGEDESTCVVYGMPRSVFEAGVTNEVVPLDQIARAIEKAVSVHQKP
jgi:two-component system, chemotaxis family, protein-glutamate methylesterase/glutaminase